jgi:CRP/FNR family transcriptional regulator, cyclic AMP receptor protein
MQSPELTLECSVPSHVFEDSQEINISPAADISSLMAGDPWFFSLEPHLRQDLLSAGEALVLRSGQVLFRRGDRPLGFYGVVDGCLKVSSMREDGREGVLGLLESGNWFGEVSLVERSTRAHDVTAIAPSSLLVVASAAFNVLMRRPAFAQAMSVLLAGRVHRLYGALEDTILRSLLAQVARRLLHLAQGDATTAASRGVRTTVPVSQEVLATMLGVTRQTLSKELRVLATAGCIVPQYGRITIVSVEKLQEFALAY